MAAVVSVGAQAAGAAGVIDKNTANAVSNSSKAVANAAEDITPEQEYYIGRAVAANILKTYSLWRGSPALTAYVNRICGAIVINSPRPEIYNGYHVAILDSNEINAFATSGGHIFITRGLLGSAKSEDALAGVIAHEIAHIQLQHSIKAIKTSRITQALMVTGASAAGAVSGYDVNEMTSIFNETVGDIVGTLVNNGYSQVQEFDADARALSLLASAGYNPGGLIDMLRELEKTQKGHSGGFNKTHPSPDKRLAAAEKVLAKQPKVTDTSSYRRARFVNK
ncbi:MAG: M48 family metalloprotease [Treponema sp.]|jgi:predicted Zn-dependent protease|nr:M48 family metalloprotease [Treponema sp.]